MFIEPTITWVPSGFSGYIWLNTKNVFKKQEGCNWGMRIDWWLQPRAVFRQTLSGIIWHMGQKKVNST